jgi:hypothetical protein
VNPHSVHRICQEIRNKRNELNAEEKWARTVDHRETRVVMLDRVFFWRRVMDYAEKFIVETRQPS